MIGSDTGEFEKLGTPNAPKEFSLSWLRCIVGCFFVLLSSRAVCHDSRSYRLSGGSVTGAKGCVTKKILYRKHNKPAVPKSILVENRPQAFQSIKGSRAITQLLMMTKEIKKI